MPDAQPARSPSLAAALRAGPVVLDGGLATELEARGYDLSGDLWSARLLRDDPDAVRTVHLAYLRAGARVVTTASYQASEPGFVAAGVSPTQARHLIRSSVTIAREAQRRFVDERPDFPATWVAASVGPYGATLADGSEYRGDYGLSVRQLRAFHRPRLDLLATAGPDVLAIETVPCLAEVEALLAEVAAVDVPAWLSLTVVGDRTRRGEPAAQAYAMARDVDAVIAVGVNCCAPADVRRAVQEAAQVSGKPALAYPNSGESWDAAARRWTGARGFAPAAVGSWMAAGARLVGGCCRVGPTEIAALAAEIRAGGSP